MINFYIITLQRIRISEFFHQLRWVAHLRSLEDGTIPKLLEGYPSITDYISYIVKSLPEAGMYFIIVWKMVLHVHQCPQGQVSYLTVDPWLRWHETLAWRWRRIVCDGWKILHGVPTFDQCKNLPENFRIKIGLFCFCSEENLIPYVNM